MQNDQKKTIPGWKKKAAKILHTVSKDIWIVILDIIAVNLSYLLALLIRFYIHFQFRPSVAY